MLDAAEFARLLADRPRLMAAGLLARGPASTADVAAALALSERDVLRILGRLAASGLVVNDGAEWRLDVDVLRDFAAALNPPEPVDPAMLRNLTADEADVAARYFRGRRLIEIPLATAKRRAVMRRLVQEFEPGRRYTEKQVNLMLGLFHPDHAALRRYLVDEGLLERNPTEGTYWRIGGPVEIEPT